MRSLAAVLVTVLLLAGCAGKAPAPQAVAEPTEDDPYALPEGVANILRGQVTSSDQTPLEGVLVELISLNLNMTTAADGVFKFENLEPHDYLVTVSHESYRTRTQRAIVEDGKIFELNFQLEDKPTVEPYKTTTPFTGLLACEGAYATNPESVEYVSCSSAVPSDLDESMHEFFVEPGAAQIVIEAVWDPTTPASENLAMEVESVGFGHQDIIFGSAHGKSGMKMQISQTLTTKYYPQGGTVRVSMNSAPSVGDEASVAVGAAIQQPFDIHFTVFYVEPGPADFSAVPQ